MKKRKNKKLLWIGALASATLPIGLIIACGAGPKNNGENNSGGSDQPTAEEIAKQKAKKQQELNHKEISELKDLLENNHKVEKGIVETKPYGVKIHTDFKSDNDYFKKPRYYLDYKMLLKYLAWIEKNNKLTYAREKVENYLNIAKKFINDIKFYQQGIYKYFITDLGIIPGIQDIQTSYSKFMQEYYKNHQQIDELTQKHSRHLKKMPSEMLKNITNNLNIKKSLYFLGPLFKIEKKVYRNFRDPVGKNNVIQHIISDKTAIKTIDGQLFVPQSLLDRVNKVGYYEMQDEKKYFNYDGNNNVYIASSKSHVVANNDIEQAAHNYITNKYKDIKVTITKAQANDSNGTLTISLKLEKDDQQVILNNFVINGFMTTDERYLWTQTPWYYENAYTRSKPWENTPQNGNWYGGIKADIPSSLNLNFDRRGIPDYKTTTKAQIAQIFKLNSWSSIFPSDVMVDDVKWIILDETHLAWAQLQVTLSKNNASITKEFYIKMLPAV